MTAVGWALVLAFIVVPVVEIYVIVQVGQQIGAVPTVLLLLVESLIGAWILKREGGRAWRGINETVSAGQLPHRELADAALVLIGGTLLLTPGLRHRRRRVLPGAAVDPADRPPAAADVPGAPADA